MLKHILVTLDSNKHTQYILAHATNIASASDAKITLLRLFDGATAKNKTRIVDPLDWHIRKLEAESGLKKLADTLRKRGLEVDTALLEGADAEQLIQYVQVQRIDLVILAKSGNVDNFVDTVMKRTATPVVILPVGHSADLQSTECYRKILVPLDGSQRAEVALPIATTLARHCNSQILLTHVVRKPEMPRHAPPNAEEIELVDRIVELNRAEAARYLENIAIRLGENVETRLLVSDNIVATLHGVIEQDGVDLVLVSAHGYSGEPQWTYGSITSNLISYGTKPTLVVQDLPISTSTQEMEIPSVARSAKTN